MRDTTLSLIPHVYIYMQCWSGKDGDVHTDGDSSEQDGGSGAYLPSGDCTPHEGSERDAGTDSSKWDLTLCIGGGGGVISIIFEKRVMALI